ncbi:glycosyl hydrolase [Sphingobacterium sp. Mn56C]|uniref:glycosyl hydrolase n=1 Tax=Sphingobacterium sp. Mn56C TaxID=3395261 RepID=UPI003BC32125
MKKICIAPLLVILCLTFGACSKSNNESNIEVDKDADIVLNNLQKRSLKRGVSYNFQMPEDVDLLAPAVSWFYNWANDISPELDQAITAKGMDYYPMTWNGNFNKDKIRAYKQKHPNCAYLLAYNEPNLTDQANMTPAEAASIWPEVRALAQELNMKIISPAMNYGTLNGYEDPIKWLDEFFALVPLDEFDGIAIHCYMAVPSAFKSYVQMFKKYNKPIWMTEFCAWEPSIKNVSQQMKYMVDVVNYMESSPDVFRYAWFIPRTAGAIENYPFMQLLTKNKPYALSDLGKVYVHMSTQDRSVYHKLNAGIPAAHYSSLNMAETANTASWTNSINIRPTSDNVGVLEVFNFTKDLWLEYQVEMPNDGEYTLDLRYTTYIDAAIAIYSDGDLTGSIDLPDTGSEKNWNIVSKKIKLKKGQQTIRLKVTKGFTSLSWLRFR